MASDDDVLSNLPRTRPQRRSAKRDAPAREAKAAAAAPRARAAAKPKATTAAAKPKAKPKRKPAAARDLPPSGFQQPRETAERPAPSGAELVGTAIQAAGELAQIGAAVGKQALKSTLGRLGRG